MSVISMKQLLEAGVHFGHQTRRWNPKMAPYIYTERNGIYIIDLQKSVGKVDEAYKAYLRHRCRGRQHPVRRNQEAGTGCSIKTEAERCGMYYVNQRWLGGMLTNFKTIQSRIARLNVRSRPCLRTVLLMYCQRRKLSQLKKEWEKLEKNLGGIKDMTEYPGCNLRS